MMSIPLDSYESIADAVISIKAHDEVKQQLAEHEQVFTDAVKLIFPEILHVSNVMWNYAGFLSYYARNISVWTPASETPVLSFCPKHDLNGYSKFTSQARAKLAGIACALHELFSTRKLYADMHIEDRCPAKRALLGVKLDNSVRKAKHIAFSFNTDLKSLPEMKAALEEIKLSKKDVES